MRKFSFIIFNLISIIVEYLLIFIFLEYVFGFKHQISIIISLVVFVLMSCLTIIAYKEVKKPTNSEEAKPYEDLILPLIDKVNKEYGLHLKLYYIKAVQPNPAWCIGNCIYVNNNFKINSDFLMGIISHELGHAISGISNYTYLASLKPSTLIGKVLYLTVIALSNSKNRALYYLGYVFYILSFVISLNNIIFVYHFVKDDEFVANEYAIKLGFGDSLRSYYGLIYRDEINKLMVKADFLHPSIDEMITRINNSLHIKKELEDIYYIDNKLIISYQKTKTITLPTFITEIGPNAFFNKELRKVSSKFVHKIDSRTFNLNHKLEEINLPNLEVFNLNNYRGIKNLKDVNIKNIDINIEFLKKAKTCNIVLYNKLMSKLIKLNDERVLLFIKENNNLGGKQ